MELPRGTEQRNTAAKKRPRSCLAAGPWRAGLFDLELGGDGVRLVVGDVVGDGEFSNGGFFTVLNALLAAALKVGVVGVQPCVGVDLAGGGVVFDANAVVGAVLEAGDKEVAARGLLGEHFVVDLAGGVDAAILADNVLFTVDVGGVGSWGVLIDAVEPFAAVFAVTLA